MKRLLLVRHAKSSWEHDLQDHQRPLKERGCKDAGLVSKSLTLKSFRVDLVVSSDAVRTRQTASIFVKNLEINQNLVKFSHNLYDFSGEKLLNFVKSCDDSIQNLMIFGHNHALTAFVNTFGSEYIENIPTSGVAIIEFNIENWSDLTPGKTIFTLFPRDLKNKG